MNFKVSSHANHSVVLRSFGSRNSFTFILVYEQIVSTRGLKTGSQPQKAQVQAFDTGELSTCWVTFCATGFKSVPHANYLMTALKLRCEKLPHSDLHLNFCLSFGFIVLS